MSHGRPTVSRFCPARALRARREILAYCFAGSGVTMRSAGRRFSLSTRCALRLEKKQDQNNDNLNLLLSPRALRAPREILAYCLVGIVVTMRSAGRRFSLSTRCSLRSEKKQDQNNDNLNLILSPRALRAPREILAYCYAGSGVTMRSAGRRFSLSTRRSLRSEKKQDQNNDNLNLLLSPRALRAPREILAYGFAGSGVTMRSAGRKFALSTRT
ncbi:MAG TPA: hypothetical protein VEB21_14845 [Terriglobales bacterium]|nr:hypothetical protein [Terriglobales bacterium]